MTKKLLKPHKISISYCIQSNLYYLQEAVCTWKAEIITICAFLQEKHSRVYYCCDNRLVTFLGKFMFKYMKLLAFAVVTFLKSPANSKTMMTLIGKMGLGEPKAHET